MSRKIIEKCYTLIEIISEINEIAKKGTLPDGDGVNIPTILWAEDAMERFYEKYTIVFDTDRKENMSTIKKRKAT